METRITKTRRSRPMSFRALVPALVVAPLVFAAGCTTTGTGAGTDLAGGTPVNFNWKSRDGGQTGTMTARLADGQTYTGPFVQLSQTTDVQVLVPLWDGWQPGWGDWGYWGPYVGPVPETAFITRYSGKVVANLKAANGQQLRCRFHLNTPVDGMGGGGVGECQARNGDLIAALFGQN